MACLPYEWETPQKEAVICYLDNLNLTYLSQKCHWTVLEELCDRLNQPMSVHLITLSNWLQARCNVIKDNKLPIPKQLLINLCQAADVMFEDHEALLIKCMFLAAWGGFMRLCEYTEAKKGRKSHNLHWDAITLNDLGFGVSFWTDKASREDPAAKHRQIAWSFLPDFAQSVFKAYMKARPKGVHYFL